MNVKPRWGVKFGPLMNERQRLLIVTPWRRFALVGMGNRHRVGVKTWPRAKSRPGYTTISAGLGRLGSLRIATRSEEDFT